MRRLPTHFLEHKSSVEIRDTWDAGRPITSLKEITSPTAICYSTDSRYLYVASSMNICVYETRSNTLVAKWDLQITPSLMATNPKGLHLAASEGTTIAIVDLESGKTKALLQKTGNITDMTYSEDCSMLAIATENGLLSIHDTRNYGSFKIFNRLGNLKSVAFHPEGKYITATTGAGQISIFNINDEQERASLTDDETNIGNLRFLKDGKRNVYLSYTTPKAIKYKLLSGLTPNYTKLLTDELNERMNEWAQIRPDESIEQYQKRVNEETRARQVRLFEQEIATRMADNMITHSEIRLGNYNSENNMLTIGFDNLPQIYLVFADLLVTN